MSHSTLYVFLENGEAVAHKEFRNGYGSAPRVWNSLSEKYRTVLHPDADKPVFMMQLWQDIWSIEKKTSIPWWEHNLLHWTFDNALIRAVDVPLFIESLKRYDREFPNERHVSHLAELATVLTALLLEAGPNLVAIGYQHTSASDNPWAIYSPETEDYEPYNMLTGTKHWFVEMQGLAEVPSEASATSG